MGSAAIDPKGVDLPRRKSVRHLAIETAKAQGVEVDIYEDRCESGHALTAAASADAATLGPLWLTPIGHPAVPSPAATGDGDGVCEAVWPPGVSREQVARFIHERVTQLSSLQTPRVNKGAMREKRESPSLVAMRARGALLAMCERSPSRAHRDLESALATPTAAYLELAGRSPRPTA